MTDPLSHLNELLTHEKITTRCGMATQKWMATQYDQASHTCMTNRPNMRGNPTAHRSQPSLTASQALAPCARQPDFRVRPFFLLQSLRCTSQDMRMEKHCTYPSFVRTTHESQSVGQPGQNTTSIESSKDKNPNPMLHLIQHHLALLHASSWGNDRIGSLDLLDSGG